MGGGKYFLKEGGFSEYLYEEVRVIEFEGFVVKVIKKKGDDDHHFGLPAHSNTSTYYAVEGEDGIKQMKFYVDRTHAIDFDWGHKHGEFNKGEVHVHEYKAVDDRPEPRRMTKQEYDKYNRLLKHLNSNIRITYG